MAPGKARNNKRSSGSSSYASTVTTAVFIALGVLGVWVLTSNSVTPPQTTTRTATSTADYSSTAKNSVFEDNPGQLPDEAIQSDDSAQSKKINAQERSQAENSNDSMKIQILTENADEAAESNIYKENLQSLQGKESVEEQEKQKLPETRVSEESSMTEGQQVEERTMEQERKAEETNQNNFEGEDRQKTRDEQERDGKEDVQDSTVLEETQMNAEADRHHGSLQDPITDNYQQQTAQDELQKEEEEQKRGEDSQQREDEQESNGKEVRESKVIEEAQRNAEADHHGNLQDQISYKDQQQRTAAADHHGNRQDQISYKDQQQRNEEADHHGNLFDRDVLAMSFAPKDEHEAQVQFALERGIPAISAVMGSQRLPFPSMVFDLVHCARCRVPWHAEGGAHLLELNRVLRPGGYFVWSATPVYQKLKEDAEIWKEMSALTESMCWELVTIKKDKLNSVGVAIYHKPVSNVCYDQRKQSHPLMCDSDDDPNAAGHYNSICGHIFRYVALQSCMHRLPVDKAERGSQWPEKWPNRIHTPPYWLNKSQMGIYGKPAPDDFVADYEHWKSVVRKMYLSGLGISWNNVRNIMDMRAVYGGFAAAIKDLKVWVLNVVNVDSPDTLPIIYERGLFGIYHDWCESFSTYPRTFDLLHADRLFSRLKKRCKLVPVMAEIDRLARPGGKLIVHDESSTIEEVENLLKSMHWEVHLTFSKNQEGILSAQKSDWRPDTYAASF